MANFVKVAAVGDVPPGTGKCVERYAVKVEGDAVLVAL